MELHYQSTSPQLNVAFIVECLLSKPDFGLPYWDWAEDGELPASLQWRADLWNSNYLGEARGAVRSGILGDMRVRLVMSSSSAELISINPRPIERAAGQGIFSLPIKQDEQRVIKIPAASGRGIHCAKT